MDLLQDARFAVRSLRRQPGVALIAIACLALGIGANTAIFSVVRAVLLGSLPYREPARLIRLNETSHPQGQQQFIGSTSVPNLKDWREQNHSFQDLAAYDNRNVNLAGDLPERLRVVAMTANTFEVLGVPAAVGRTFRPGEDELSAAPVVVLSDGLWRRRFGARHSVVDSTILLDGRPFTVIGVMSDGFDFPVSTVRQDAWIPLPLALNPELTGRGNHWLQVIGRLKPGVTQAAAEADLGAIAVRLAHDFPGNQKDRGVLLRPAAEVVVGGVRTPLLILLGAVGLVLAIACANVANLLLARATSRGREVAIRVALGADARRIARQVLTESMLLSLAGGALGLLVAFGSLRAILVLAAAALPRAGTIGLDPLVLGFTLLVSLATGILFGLAPALRATRTDVREGLMDGGGKASAGIAHHRLLRTLVVAEMALSLVLVAGAGLLVRSFVGLTQISPGLEPAGVLTFRVRVATASAFDSTPYPRFYGPALERIGALPGVRSAGIINLLPIQSWGMNGDFQIVGRPQDPDPTKQPFAEFRVVSSGYFEALRIKVRQGRAFSDHDVMGSQPVVMINEDFARRYFPGEQPVGQQLRAWSRDPCTIVGVAANVRQTGLDHDAASEVYVNAAQNPWRLGNMSFVVATRGSPEGIVGAVREALRSVAPDQPIYAVESMEQVIGDSLRGRKLTLVLLGVLAGLALLLAAAGIYGVLSYTIAQRTRELGIRMALGASGGAITRMVLGDAARLAAIGVVLGLAGALALVSLLKSMIYGVGVRDPLTLALAALMIPVVALVASAVPALRAARADPLIAMRAE